VIDLYYWPTPNGHKITIFLEEAGLAYTLRPVDITRGDQLKPEFLEISPNNRIPALVDHGPVDGGAGVTLFESGAILLYLAEKTGQFLSSEIRQRQKTLQWLFWQVGGLGPMAGQNHHFGRYAPARIPYAIDRYHRETARLYSVLDRQLAGKSFIVDQYSIADMACYPWIAPHADQGQDLDDYPHLKRWFESLKARPAVIRAYAAGEPYARRGPDLTALEREILFGVTASRTV
jgi:GST-like protein